jgi:hypothetical protein
MVTTGSDETFRYVFTDAGAGSIMVPYNGDDDAIAWLRDDIEYLPFLADPENTGRVLILGAGAGRDVLMARLAGAEAITAVEINPTLVDITRDTADYNGSVFDLPGVQTIVTDGRNYIERSDAVYDLIYANVVYSQAAAPGSAALAENYIFTREALATYWNRLSENGHIGFVTHHGIEGLRLLVAALDMLRDDGKTVQEALRHVALVSINTGAAETRTSVVMVSRQPWTSQQANSCYPGDPCARRGGAVPAALHRGRLRAADKGRNHAGASTSAPTATLTTRPPPTTVPSSTSSGPVCHRPADRPAVHQPGAGVSLICRGWCSSSCAPITNSGSAPAWHRTSHCWARPSCSSKRR